MATVTTFGDSPETTTHREVKNLGWVLRNWKTARYITVSLYGGLDGGMLRVHLDGERMFSTRFASESILLAFIDRPIFRTLPLRVIDLGGRNRDLEGATVGDTAHRALIARHSY